MRCSTRPSSPVRAPRGERERNGRVELAERLQDTPAFQATLPEPETLANELT